MHAKFPPIPQATAAPTQSSSSSSSHGNSHDSLNPLNLMPNLSQSRSPNQTLALPTERTLSSIPKGTDPSSKEVWEYPSPQQMYNAMIRKGGPAPEDAVESMVNIHNFLNEGAWAEILEWERRWAGGVGRGLRVSFSDSPEDAERDLAKLRREAKGVVEESAVDDDEDADPSTGARLLRFEGRSQDRTPKSRIIEALSKFFPSAFSDEVPFDRHDWYVLRKDGTTVRYVIDYYGGGMEAGMPTFYLDVRPALDKPSAALERLGMWGGDIWRKASGAEARRAERRGE